jgi:hypothetical protein
MPGFYNKAWKGNSFQKCNVFLFPLAITGTVFGNNLKNAVMFPVWFFIILIGVICYLLYITRTTEEDILMMSKNQLKRFQYWMKENAQNKLE